MSNKAVCIFMSDVHLCDKAPALRQNEIDWYEAMRRPLREIRLLAKKLKAPVVCAGDVFDKWKSTPELINFAIQELPMCYAVPGQHDLPYHNYEDIEKSSYWTLVEAGVVRNIEAGGYIIDDSNDLIMHGFPYGFDPHPQSEPKGDSHFRIAVVHEYCWIGKYKYETASMSQHVSNFKLDGYDAATFGDNHIGFIKGRICNCGGLMRRTSPDMKRKPMVGVLMSDKTIKKHLIDTSDDVYCLDSEDEIEETGSIELAQFTDQLLGLKQSKDLDFGQVLERYCKTNEVSRPAVKLIREAVEKEA